MMKLGHATAFVAAVFGVPGSDAFSTTVTSNHVQQAATQLVKMKMIPFFLSTEEDVEVENLREQARVLEEEAIALEKQAIALEEVAAKEASLKIGAKTEAESALEEASEAKLALVAALETKADLDDTFTQQQQQQTTLLTDGITAEEAENIRDARVSGEKEEEVRTTQLVAIKDGVSTAEDAEAVRLDRLRAADEVAKKNDISSFEQPAMMKSATPVGIENRSLRRMSLRERLNQIETKTEVKAAPRMNQQQTGSTNKASAPSLSSLLNNPPSTRHQQNPKQESNTDTSKPTDTIIDAEYTTETIKEKREWYEPPTPYGLLDTTPKYEPPASLVKEDASVTKAVQQQQKNGEVPNKSMSLRELAMLSSRR